MVIGEFMFSKDIGFFDQAVVSNWIYNLDFWWICRAFTLLVNYGLIPNSEEVMDPYYLAFIPDDDVDQQQVDVMNLGIEGFQPDIIVIEWRNILDHKWISRHIFWHHCGWFIHDI